MSQKQWKRLDAVERLEQGKLTGAEGAQVLGLSVRQVRRLRRAVEKRGRLGVLHGNAGRAPWNRLTQQIRERIVGFRRGKYEGFNDQQFTEKLAEEEALEVSRPTVQRLLRAAGIAAKRRRRAPRHRRRRDRKAQAGLMILWDASRHDWLEGRGPYLSLMGAVDDATGELLPGAHFVEQECSAGYLKVLNAIANEKGLPWSAYMDQHGSLRRNDDQWTLEEELRGRQDPTQVGTALEALGIEAIYALSPQAKGRVERAWETLQDRLGSILRLAKASTLQQANVVLEGYRPEHNRRFAVAPVDRSPAWRSVRRGTDLVRACSFRYEATVFNDNTVRLGGVVIDIPPGPRQRSYAKARVEVRQLLDGSWRVYHRDILIAVAPSTATTELRTLKRRRRFPGRAAAGQTPVALRAPSVSPADVVLSP